MIDFEKLVENYKDEIIQSTQEAVRIKSVEEESTGPGEPFGKGPRKALDQMLNLGKDLGFKVEDFDGYAGHIEYGQGEEVVGVLAHVDVVPEGSGWTYPPYGAEIHDGKLYGRGSMDDKGPAIAVLYAMRILKDLDVNLSRKIRLIVGANEETDWRCMDHYFKHMEAPDMAFTPDANFPVIYGEMGIVNFNLEMDIDNLGEELKLLEVRGGEAANMVPESAQVLLEGPDLENLENKIDSKFKGEFDYEIKIEDGKMRLICYGISAHGSMPETGENAISHLMQVLELILEKSNSLYDFAQIYNEKIGYNLHGENIGCGFEDDISGKLIFNSGLLKIDDEKIKLVVNVRFPIANQVEEVYDGIDASLEHSKMYLVESGDSQDPLYVEKDNFLVEKLMEVYREETGDKDSQPITIGGGTYARAMENAVGFGPIYPGQVEVIHQKDEFIAIDHLMKLVSIYTKALYALCK